MGAGKGKADDGGAGRRYFNEYHPAANGWKKASRTLSRKDNRPINPANFWWAVDRHGDGSASVIVVYGSERIPVMGAMPERLARWTVYLHNLAMDKRFGTNQARLDRP